MTVLKLCSFLLVVLAMSATVMMSGVVLAQTQGTGASDQVVLPLSIGEEHDGTPPGKNMVNAVAISSTHIKLTWDSTPASSLYDTTFQIQRCLGASCTDFSTLATVSAAINNIISYNDTGLTVATNYRYRVIVNSPGTESIVSNIASATTPAADATTPAADCRVYHSTDIPKYISGVTSTLLVPDNFTIRDANVINLHLRFRPGSYGYGFYAALISPSNTRVELFANRANLDGIRLDDKAGQSIQDGEALFAGAYRPIDMLSTLNGQPGNGMWRLYAFAGADAPFNAEFGGADLFSWGLELCGVPVTPPAAPTTLTSRSASSSQIVLTWQDNATNEAGFRIQRCQDTGCTNFVRIRTVAANDASHTDRGLTADTTYRYRVRAYGSVGDSDFTDIITATTGPVAPTNLQGTVASSNQINLTWTDNSINELRYKVERCAHSDCTNFVHIATVAANATTYQNSGLAPGATYRYRVRGYNRNGNSTYSNVVTKTTLNSVSNTGEVAPAPDLAVGSLVQGNATYTTDAETDSLTIWMKADDAFTLTQGAACMDGVQPTTVELVVGEQHLPMPANTVQSGLYIASINARLLVVDNAYLVEVQWQCAGAEELMTNYVGTLHVTATTSP